MNGESVANLSHTEVILSIHKVGYNRCRTSFLSGCVFFKDHISMHKSHGKSGLEKNQVR